MMNILRKKRWLLLALLLLVACGSATEGDDVGEMPAESPTNAPETTTNTTTDEEVAQPTEVTSQTEVHPTTIPANTYDEYEIITLLPKDGIPAIDNPTFLDADEADRSYDPDELVMGVDINGDKRAYSVAHLSKHEIVNDVVGGENIAVTW